MYKSKRFLIPEKYRLFITFAGISCPPSATLVLTLSTANSTESNQKKSNVTSYPFSVAFFMVFKKLLEASVVLLYGAFLLMFIRLGVFLFLAEFCFSLSFAEFSLSYGVDFILVIKKSVHIRSICVCKMHLCSIIKMERG